MFTPKIIYQKDLTFDQIDIKFNKKSNRKIDPVLESELDKHWQNLKNKAKKAGKKIWDSEIYRLNEFKESKGRLILELSLTQFSIHKAMKAEMKRVEELGEEYYPKGIFIGGLIKTSDNKFVFGVRNKNSKTYGHPERDIDVIGGGLYLDEIKLKTGKDIEKLLLLELKEEINLDQTRIKRILFKNMFLSHAARIGINCYIKTNQTETEIRKSFPNRKDDEMADLHFVKDTDLNPFLDKLGGYKPLMKI